MKSARLSTTAQVMWTCSPSLTRPIVLSGRIGKTSLPASSMRAHCTLMLRVRSMCCSPTRRRRPGTPCSLRIWLATGYSSMRVVPYQHHSLYDSLFKGFLNTKEPTLIPIPRCGRDGSALWVDGPNKMPIQAVSHPKCDCCIAAFSRLLSRCYPCVLHPPMVHYWCAIGIGGIRRTHSVLCLSM
jgi:hypothetical protein